MVGWDHRCDRHEFEKLLELVRDREACHAAVHGLRSDNREGTQPHPSTENWIKDLLSILKLIKTRPFPPQSVCPIRKLPQTSYPSPSEGRQTENHKHRKQSNLITWITALSKSMKL